MSLIEDFFAQGVADQVSVMGSPVKLKSMPKGTLSKEFKAILTSRSGDLQLEVGGALYTVTAHVLIPTSANIIPKVSDQIISGEDEYVIITVVRSVIDKAFSCDLVKID